MVNEIQPYFVAVNDGAKYVGVRRSTFYKLVAEGKIPLVKLGRRSLVPVAALREFADQLVKAA